jgi:alkylation response protein AidB-like acyl-CoA dehydrogenase
VNFDFSDDQKELKEQARKFLTDKSSAKAVRGVLEKADVSFDTALWKGVAELGWLGVAIPEEYGGLGLGRRIDLGHRSGRLDRRHLHHTRPCAQRSRSSARRAHRGERQRDHDRG